MVMRKEKKTIISRSEAATIKLAKSVVGELTPGAALGLVGELGAGKTQFVKGLARALGIKKNIASPTFILLKSYKLPKAAAKGRELVHADCYRLESSQELLDLGWQEIIKDRNNIVVVEWADKIKDIMPDNTLWIEFKTGQESNERIIAIDGFLFTPE